MKSKRHLEKQNEIEMIIPERFFKENIGIKKLYNPNSEKQRARDNIQLENYMICN